MATDFSVIAPGVYGAGSAVQGGVGAAGGFNMGGYFDEKTGAFVPWQNKATDIGRIGRMPGFYGHASGTWGLGDIPEYGYGEDEQLYRDYATQFNPYVQGLMRGHTSELGEEHLDANPEHEQLIPIEDRRGVDEEGNPTYTDAYGGQEFGLGEMTPATFANYPPRVQEMIWNHLGGMYPWEVGPDQYVGDYGEDWQAPGIEGGGTTGGTTGGTPGGTGGTTGPTWWPGQTKFPPTAGTPENEYPNIDYPSGDNYSGLTSLYSQRQPDPMWGGGPASWFMGSPISNSWMGGMPIMANNPWASIQAPMTPNAYDAYWNMMQPLVPTPGEGGWTFDPEGEGWPQGFPYLLGGAQGGAFGGSDQAAEPAGDQAAEPVVDQAAEPAAGGQTFLEQYGMSQEAYNTAVSNFNQQMMSGFQDFMGVSPQQYAMAQDPSGWRGDQTFGERVGMTQEAYNVAINAANQKQMSGFQNLMGVTPEQYSLAQDPSEWRGDQTFGERVGMSQEAYNTSRNKAWQTYKQGKPVFGPGAQGGAYGTFDPTIGAQGAGAQGGAFGTSQQATAAPDAAAAAATPAPVTGTGQITPGVMGGAGSAAQFGQNPNAWNRWSSWGNQYGSPSPITPGTLGGAQPEPTPATGAGQITPGVLGGMGTVPQSPSPITPGATQAEPAHTPFFGAPSPITPGTMGGAGTAQPSPITPGTLGGGRTPSPITPGTMGGMGTGQTSPITPGRMGGAPQEQWNYQGMFSRQGTYPQNQITPGAFGGTGGMPGAQSPITPGRMGGGNYQGMFSMHRPNGTRPVYGSQQRRGF